jgi:hypothetical protein
MDIGIFGTIICVFLAGVFIILVLVLVHCLLWLFLDDTYERFCDRVCSAFKKLRESMVIRRIYREMHYDSTFSYTVKKNGLLGFPFLWFREKSFDNEDAAREYITKKKREYEKKYGKKIIKSTRVK